MSPNSQTKTQPRVAPLDLSVDEQLLAGYDGPVPRHVAFIMDGNGRWARQRGLRRLKGHREGAGAVRCVVESCRYLGVDAVTLYAFSTQNWGRPDDEVSGLMTLFNVYIKKERDRLLRNGIRLRVIGDRSRLSETLRKAIKDLEDASAVNDEMLLQVAVSYGGREEILCATRELATKVRDGQLEPEEITEEAFSDHLYTRGIHDPDLVVRTSGELRISNFLLWQIAYSELYVTDVFWPDFDEQQLLDAFASYGDRERRFGQTAEQLDD
ncbi:MAG: isoprenyl transferase [Persicimonas sp.]